MHNLIKYGHRGVRGILCRDCLRSPADLVISLLLLLLLLQLLQLREGAQTELTQLGSILL